MEKVIFDCDNTMGILDRDVDDGLTLLYILGEENIDLKLLTTTFGNDEIDVVNNNTRELILNLNMKDTKVVYGVSKDVSNDKNDAAHAIIEMIRENENDITIIATGSLHNIATCERLSPGILKKAKEIIIMGGIEKSLFVDGVALDELNISCDYMAAKDVFESGSKITIATADMCLNVRFGQKEMNRLNEDKRIYKFIKHKASSWFEKFYKDYNSKEIVVWDLNCPMYLVHKELFTKEEVKISTKIDDLKIGLLRVVNENEEKTPGYSVTFLKDVRDRDKFHDKVFESFSRVELK